MKKLFVAPFCFFVLASGTAFSQDLNTDAKFIQLKKLSEVAQAKGLQADYYLNSKSLAELQNAYASGSAKYNQVLQSKAEKIASDLQIGRVLPGTFGQRVYIKAKAFTAKNLVTQYLESQLDISDLITNIEPKNYFYKNSLELLSYFNSLVETNQHQVPTDLVFNTLGIQRQDQNLTHYLRSRLQILGYNNNINSLDFDSELELVVRQYQEDHKLDVDGVVGPGTWGYLNRNILDIIRQLNVNIDRTRWLSDAIPAGHVYVNTAAQHFTFVQNNMPTMSFKTINGRTDRQTPIMVDAITRVSLNPTWTVPFSIFVKDKLPKIKEDPGYIIKLNMRLIDDLTGKETDPYSVDWSLIDETNLHYTLIQRPGPQNALGFIVFALQNPYAIYLHDTDSRGLFSQSYRLLSSGCVRLQQPFEFAEKILANPQWTVASLKQATELRPKPAESPTRLSIPKNIPVFLLYSTVSKLSDGRIIALPDYYEIDKKMIELH